MVRIAVLGCRCGDDLAGRVLRILRTGRAGDVGSGNTNCAIRSGSSQMRIDSRARLSRAAKA